MLGSRRHGLVAAALALGYLLSACSLITGEGASGENASAAPEVTQQSDSELEEIRDISAMVPQALKDSGVLRVGISLSNPPSSFYDPNTAALGGFDVEISQAMGQVMGLPDVEFVPVAFSRLLQHLGTDYEVGAAFTSVTSQRLEKANFITYGETGSAYAVGVNNPEGFTPDMPCGRKVAVQSSTVQQDQLELRSAECIQAEEPAVEIVSLPDADAVFNALNDEEAVAIYWDAIVLESMAARPGSRIVQIGSTGELGPIGISVSHDDQQLTVAVHAAVQFLMDEGVIATIFSNYGVPEAALSAATINPKVN